MPSFKLLEIKRVGLRYKRIHDKPKTPLKRLLEIYPHNRDIIKIV